METRDCGEMTEDLDFEKKRRRDLQELLRGQAKLHVLLSHFQGIRPPCASEAASASFGEDEFLQYSALVVIF